MLFRHRKASLAMFSILSLSVSACGPSPTINTPSSSTPLSQPTLLPSPSASTTLPSSSASGVPDSVGPTPTPVFSITPGPSSNPNSGSTATVNLPNGTRLVIALPNRFLSSKGQSVQLNAQLFDASDQALPLGDIKLLFSSSRPLDFSVSDAGVVMALKDSGYSTLTVRVEGTDLTATQLISVNSFVGGSSGSSGGGGGSSSPSASPTPPTQVNANVNFEGLGIGEFSINTSTGGEPRFSAVAMDADGDFVVTWQSRYQEGNYYDVYAQRYSAAGVAQGSQFRVNTYTTNNQRNPAVAMDADGDFVVTWESLDGSNNNNYNNIYARRYSAAGVAQDSEFKVNTYTYNVSNSAVAMDNDGDFVVTWESLYQDYSRSGIYARRYNAASGVDNGAQDSEFKVNTSTIDEQRNPAIAMDADGDFVVTWQGESQYGYEIYARRYSAASGGNNGAQGSEFQVSTYTIENQKDPAIAMDADGNFVVTWQSDEQDGNSFGIYARRYSAASGVDDGALGSEFQINAYTTRNQGFPAVAMDTDGDFVVTWESFDQDGSSHGIYGQRYGKDGTDQGTEFRINTFTTDGQRKPAVAMDTDGDFVVTWHSYGQDGNDYGIYAKQYQSNGMAK